VADLRGALTKLAEEDAWFTVTKVVVRVSPSLGGYTLDLEGPEIPDEFESLAEQGKVDRVITITGVAHPPGRSDWIVAFRIDDTGPHVAANAPDLALKEIAPRLKEVAASV
jgi:hypothetical protein